MRYKVVTDSVSVSDTRGILEGFSLRATSTAVVNIRDGGASGSIIVPLNIAANTSVLEQTLDLPFNTDIYFEVVSGVVLGTVWVE